MELLRGLDVSHQDVAVARDVEIYHVVVVGNVVERVVAQRKVARADGNAAVTEVALLRVEQAAQHLVALALVEVAQRVPAQFVECASQSVDDLNLLRTDGNHLRQGR